MMTQILRTLCAASCSPQNGGTDSRTGLPDGLFSNKKSQFGHILEGFEMENVFIFYDNMEC
jgi:hypothetical protein